MEKLAQAQVSVPVDNVPMVCAASLLVAERVSLVRKLRPARAMACAVRSALAMITTMNVQTEPAVET